MKNKNEVLRIITTKKEGYGMVMNVYDPEDIEISIDILTKNNEQKTFTKKDIIKMIFKKIGE